MRRPRSHLLACAALVGLALSGISVRAADRPLRDVIDARVQAVWKREKIEPAKPAGDAEFLRRVYLDLLGSIPTVEETIAFLDSKKPDKREKLVDLLLEDPRFAQHQADVWDMILFGRRPPGFDTDRREGFQAWLLKQFDKNVPYNVWARELLRAEGNSVDNAALYYVQYRNAPEDASEAISQTFLGVQLQCARCHDHPFEDWTQRDFYGMAAFLARLEVVGVGKKNNLTMYVIGEKNSGDILFTGPAKDQQPGKKGEPVKPKFLQGESLAEPSTPPKIHKEPRFAANKMPPKPKFSRKDQLADWITRADNPYFARAIANRLWAQYMGRGIVHPINNMSPVNKPSHPELLEELTQALVANKFDLKWYIRELVNSRTYQLSAAGTGDPLPTWFRHARMRPLSAEELTEAWRIATGYAAVEKAVRQESQQEPIPPAYGRLRAAVLRYAEQRQGRLPGRPARAPVFEQRAARVPDFRRQGQPGRVHRRRETTDASPRRTPFPGDVEPPARLRGARPVREVSWRAERFGGRRRLDAADVQRIPFQSLTWPTWPCRERPPWRSGPQRNATEGVPYETILDARSGRSCCRNAPEPITCPDAPCSKGMATTCGRRRGHELGAPDEHVGPGRGSAPAEESTASCCG